MRIGILTSGGDCPGINATLRGVSKIAINHYGMEVVGIHSGFQGLLDNDVEPFGTDNLSGLLGMGGTVLGTSRVKLFPRRGSDSQTENARRMMQTIAQFEEKGMTREQAEIDAFYACTQQQ